jgi:signal transduction histidine kinase
LDRELARNQLRSQKVSERLEAARFFVAEGPGDQTDDLRKALHDEHDALVAMVLRRAIGLVVIADERDPGVISSEASAAQAVAVEDLTRMIDHELRPILGSLRLRAAAELADYETSRTKEELDHLGDALDAFRRLGQAAKSPDFETFDAASLLEELAAGTREKHNVTIGLVGKRPFFVTGDRGLITFAVGNSLRNAAEAVISVRNSELSESEIVLAWDESDRDFWISVLDSGPGLPRRRDRIFDAGSTTKEGHLGMGLTIAMRAAMSMGAKLELSNANGKGALFLLRWEKPAS